MRIRLAVSGATRKNPTNKLRQQLRSRIGCSLNNCNPAPQKILAAIPQQNFPRNHSSDVPYIFYTPGITALPIPNREMGPLHQPKSRMTGEHYVSTKNVLK